MSFSQGNKSYSIDSERYHNITIGVKKQGNVNCYHLDDPEFSYFENPYFVGSLKKGGSVNCEKISLYAHASGTHTECALHVLDVDFSMLDIELPPVQLCRLVTLAPKKKGDDAVIDADVLAGIENSEACTAICIRTLPNEADKLHHKYADTNPPYFTTDAIAKIKALGFEQLLTDLPSIDKEQDDGLLAAHKQWFTTDNVPDRKRTITEFIYIDNAIEDGVYGIAIHCPKIETDAVTSQVILYPCV
ncbi:MAG: cyclase family protein [Bacteroidota bacterium]